jgi:hypothetical protein
MNRSSWTKLLAILSLAVLAASCSSPSLTEDEVPRKVSADGGPPASFSEAGDRSAAELLSASDLVMQRLEHLSVSRTIRYPEMVERDELSLSPAISWASGQRIVVDGVISGYADRSRGGLWLPDFFVDQERERGVTGARDVRFIGETQEQGQDAWVIWYSFTQTSTEVPFPVWRTEWIAKDSLRLLRQVQDDDDPLGGRPRVESVISFPDG